MGRVRATHSLLGAFRQNVNLWGRPLKKPGPGDYEDREERVKGGRERDWDRVAAPGHAAEQGAL